MNQLDECMSFHMIGWPGHEYNTVQTLPEYYVSVFAGGRKQPQAYYTIHTNLRIHSVLDLYMHGHRLSLFLQYNTCTSTNSSLMYICVIVGWWRVYCEQDSDS